MRGNTVHSLKQNHTRYKKVSEPSVYAQLFYYKKSFYKKSKWEIQKKEYY